MHADKSDLLVIQAIQRNQTNEFVININCSDETLICWGFLLISSAKPSQNH